MSLATPVKSGLPPTQHQLSKNVKKLPKIGMGTNPVDVFIRSLRLYPAAGEKSNKSNDPPQQFCSRTHQSSLLTSSCSSSSCSPTQNSAQSTISFLN